MANTESEQLAGHFLSSPPTALVSAPQSKQADLLVNQPATVNFKLTVQSTAVTVDVSGEAETLNTTDASIGNSVNNATIQALPMEGRNVTDLLSLQPGVLYLGQQTTEQQDQDGRSGSVAGARYDQTNVTLDGLDDNDQQNGYAFTGVLRFDARFHRGVPRHHHQLECGCRAQFGAQVTLVTKWEPTSSTEPLTNTTAPVLGARTTGSTSAGELTAGEPNVPGKLHPKYVWRIAGRSRQERQAFLFLQL